LGNTDLTQQIRAAVAGENRSYLESTYAGSGLVLASLLFGILVDCLIVFAVRLVFLNFGGLPSEVCLLKSNLLFDLEFSLVLIWITLDYCVNILVKIFTTDCWIVLCVFNLQRKLTLDWLNIGVRL
jgi:hypothetical protein